MFFTSLGTVVAWLVFFLAAYRIGMAFYIGMFITDAQQASAWAARYLATGDTSRAFSEAIPVAGFAIAIGILAEISRAVRR